MIWAVLWVLMWILVGLFALFLLFLVLTIIPIKYEATVAVGDGTHALVRVSYLFRLIVFVYEYSGNTDEMYVRIAGFRKGLNFDTPKKDESKLPREKVDAKGAKLNLGEIIKDIGQALTSAHVKTTIRLGTTALKKMLKVLIPKKLDVSGVVGFADPAHTGWFIGFYEAVVGLFNIRQQVRFAGDFEASATVVRVDAFVQGSVSVARLAWPLIWLVLHRPVRFAIRDFLK